MRHFVLAGLLCMMAGATVQGQITSFTISGGYSNVRISHNSSDLFYNHDGGYFDGEFMWQVPGGQVPLLLGGSISGSGYYNYEYIPVTFSNGYPGSAELDSYLDFVSFEFRAAVPFSFGRRGGSGFFVVPKVGTGLLIDTYSIDYAQSSNGLLFLSTAYHTGAAFDIRPGIQAGYSWGWGSAGVDASYMAAFGDFGRLGSIAQEFRIGAFFRVKF